MLCYLQIHVLKVVVLLWLLVLSKVISNANLLCRYKYAWADGVTIKRPIEVSAPVYTDYLMKWVQAFVLEDKNFPANETTPFAKDFRENMKNIYKRLFRVYAHCFQHHEEQISQSGLEKYWNTSFKKFYLLIVEFGLVDAKEMMALEKKINQINSGAIWRIFLLHTCKIHHTELCWLLSQSANPFHFGDFVISIEEVLLAWNLNSEAAIHFVNIKGNFFYWDDVLQVNASFRRWNLNDLFRISHKAPCYPYLLAWVVNHDLAITSEVSALPFGLVPSS